MSKPLTWDKSKDNPKQNKRPEGSSKWRKDSFPTAESIWKQGKGGS